MASPCYMKIVPTISQRNACPTSRPAGMPSKSNVRTEGCQLGLVERDATCIASGNTAPDRPGARERSSGSAGPLPAHRFPRGGAPQPGPPCADLDGGVRFSTPHAFAPSSRSNPRSRAKNPRNPYHAKLARGYVLWAFQARCRLKQMSVATSPPTAGT